MYKGDSISKNVEFIVPSSFQLYLHFNVTKPGKWYLRGRQANKGVLCLKERINSLHLSDLEGLQGKKRLKVRGGDIYLLCPPFCAEVLEGRSVLDRQRKPKAKVYFLCSFCKAWEREHLTGCLQNKLTLRKESTWVSTPEISDVWKSPTWGGGYVQIQRSDIKDPQSGGRGVL